MPETSLFEQVRATMLVTVFVFLGIEGASVYSRYAKKRSDVGAATILGFVGVTALMVLVTLLPYAVLPRAEIAGMRQPSMAAVLEAVVGHWGAVFISIGLLVSVLGAYLAWSLICAEVLFAAGQDQRHADGVRHARTRTRCRRRRCGSPTSSSSCSSSRTYWSRDAFTLMLEPDQRDVADPVLSGGGVRRAARAGAARPTRCGRRSAGAT